MHVQTASRLEREFSMLIAVEQTGVRFVLQEQQLGTGHALQMLKAYFALSGEPIPGNLLVLSGDVPRIRPETIASIAEFHFAA